MRTQLCGTTVECPEEGVCEIKAVTSIDPALAIRR